MVKCKRCGIDDLTWDREYNEASGKWRLWNPNTERPHECQKRQNDQFEKEDSDNDRYGMSKHDKMLWKKDWKPEMDLPTFVMCGVCNDGTECVIVSDCSYCMEHKLGVCNHWCPKCKEHTMISLHTTDKENFKRLENNKKKG